MGIPDIIPPGSPATAEWWEKTRRPELLRLFSENVYGVTPAELPKASYSLVDKPCGYPGVNASVLTITMERNGRACSFCCDIYCPAEAADPMPAKTAAPMPVSAAAPMPAEAAATMPAVIMIDPFSRRGWDAEQIYSHCPPDIITRAGFMAVHAHVDQACADDAREYGRGLMELYPPEGAAGWGAVGGWAFCASRVVDYLLARGDVKTDGIAVCGCSRAGKTALWCGAQDTRVAVTISNVSGCTGAAITRDKKGERVADITSVFPHWFCANYAAYSGREVDLPVDQHMLLALCAPRPVYVSSASEDEWADPQMEFAAALLCGDAYEIFGKSGLPDEYMPPVNTPLLSGDVGYHNRQGEHGCETYDWEIFLKFMKKYV